jgi:hypothetical protein
VSFIAILYANFHSQSQLSSNAQYFYEHLQSRETNIPYDLFWLEASPEVPTSIKKWNAVEQIFHEPQNSGRDFGMWGRALAKIDLSRYQYVLFLNKSCYGPTQSQWLETFVNEFAKHPKAALVAPLLNYAGGWHGQTWAFMLKVGDVQDLLKNEPRAFGNKMKFAPYWVFDSRELLISQYFLKQGRSIVGMVKHYPEVFLHTRIQDHAGVIATDPNYGFFREGLSGNLSLRQQLVFIKDTRGK